MFFWKFVNFFKLICRCLKGENYEEDFDTEDSPDDFPDDDDDEDEDIEEDIKLIKIKNKRVSDESKDQLFSMIYVFRVKTLW